ncbi:MAG: oligoendopeptidase F [Defluviitaleaceae bacterium]|nr:oligoendopeptidase F [Defluviitaleaceae bacterium]
MAELKTRAQIAPEFKWNTAAICETDDIWQKRVDAVVARIDEIKAFEGKLGDSGKSLLDGLKLLGELEQETWQLFIYAGLKGDEDTAEPKYQGMRDKMKSVATQMQAAVSFIDPEIISIGEAKVNEFVAATAGLEIYKHHFADMFRKQKHILSPELEEFMAKASEIGGAASSIYNMIYQTDMVFGKVLDGEGKEHELTSGRFGALMQSTDRVLRKNAHELYYDTYIKQKNTIAEAYNYSVKNDCFVASARNYESALDAGLSEYNIPKEIYTNLIKTVDDNMHLFHRYLDLRKKCLGVDQLEFYDIYAPIVKDADVVMDWEQAKKTVMEGVAVLGEEYQGLVQKSYDESWIDVYENKGKRGGAYSWGSYGMKHPFVLMNYDDTVGDMFTLAHELGHAMHSYYTHRGQPQVYGGYTIFLAEVASTVNETLVMEHLLENTTDKTKYSYLLNMALEGIRGTIFRQTMFAEFEMLSHEMAERGEALNSLSLSGLYKNLLEKHFGDKMTIDERIIHEWSRIPHFYRAYYVYQYATGHTSAIALAKGIREQGAPAVEKYINFLKGGSSDYSVELLKGAGVDMTSPAPIQAAMDYFKDLLDRFEKANFE